MIREAVSSSMLTSVGYDAAAETLEVEYRPDRNGVSGVYTYRPVTAEEYAVLRAADSIGRALVSLKSASSWECVKIATIIDGVETPIDSAA